MKKICAVLLSICMMLGVMPINSYAEEADRGKETVSNLEVGKTYSVPLVKYGEDGNTKDWASVDYKGQDILDNSALVEKNSDGTYKVTLSWANYRYFDMVQFMKPGTIEDGTSAVDTKMGTYNIPNKFVVNGDLLSDTQKTKYDFTTILKNEVLNEKTDDASNDKYIQNVTVTDPNKIDIQYVSFNVDTINKYIYYKYLATGLYSKSKLSSSANITKPQHHDEIVKRCEACFGGGAISFDLSNAQEVVSFDKYTSDNISWHVDRASNSFDDNSGDGISRNYITEEVKGLLKNNLTVNRAEDGIEVTFNFKDNSNVEAVYEAETIENNCIPSGNENSLSSVLTGYNVKLTSIYDAVVRYDTLNSILSEDKRSFTLKYENPSEAAFGKVIKVVMSDNTPYEFFVGVSAIDNTVTFTSDNMSFTTEKDNLDTTGVFASNPLTKGTDYKKMSEMLIGHCSNYLIYQPSFMVGNKKRNPKNQVDIKMTIPQGWNTEKIKVFRLNGTPSEGSLIEITQDDTTYSYALNGNELTLKTKDLNTTYILGQEGEAVSAETLKALENGVYSVDLVSWNLTQPGQLSMSNVAIDKDSTYLSVKDGVYTLYMKLQAIMISGKKGYAQKVL